MKRKFRVSWTVTTPCYADVEAESEEEALRKAEEAADNGELFVDEEGDSHAGNFCIV